MHDAVESMECPDYELSHILLIFRFLDVYKRQNQKWFDPQWRAEYLDWYVAHSSLKADILPVANTQLEMCIRDSLNYTIKRL